MIPILCDLVSSNNVGYRHHHPFSVGVIRGIFGRTLPFSVAASVNAQSLCRCVISARKGKERGLIYFLKKISVPFFSLKIFFSRGNLECSAQSV